MDNLRFFGVPPSLAGAQTRLVSFDFVQRELDAFNLIKHCWRDFERLNKRFFDMNQLQELRRMQLPSSKSGTGS
jgi:hypothetical protein